MGHIYIGRVGVNLKKREDMTLLDDNLELMTVAEIVTEDIRTADIFKKNGIDFCCGGEVLLPEICNKKGVNIIQLKKDILNIGIEKNNSFDFNSWKLDFLVDYIENTHHKYVNEASQLIIQYSDKVAKVHGHHFTEVVEINKLFHALVKELAAHMKKEELILFPQIKKMTIRLREGNEYIAPPFGTVQNPIRMMSFEHDDAGEIIKEIALLSDNFTPPESACNTFRALYAKLEEFQNDLFQHIHLENNILFPKAIAMEGTIVSKRAN